MEPPSPAGMERYLKYPSMPLITPSCVRQMAQAICCTACLLLRHSLRELKKESSTSSTTSYVIYLSILRGSGASYEATCDVWTTRTRRCCFCCCSPACLHRLAHDGAGDAYGGNDDLDADSEERRCPSAWLALC